MIILLQQKAKQLILKNMTHNTMVCSELTHQSVHGLFQRHSGILGINTKNFNKPPQCCVACNVCNVEVRRLLC